MCNERFDVGLVSGENGPVRLGERDDEGVDGGAGSSAAPELGGSPGHVGRDLWLDDAGLEESVRVGVSRWIAAERLDEDHRWDDRGPEPLVHEGADERERWLGA